MDRNGESWDDCHGEILKNSEILSTRLPFIEKNFSPMVCNIEHGFSYLDRLVEIVRFSFLSWWPFFCISNGE